MCEAASLKSGHSTQKCIHTQKLPAAHFSSWPGRHRTAWTVLQAAAEHTVLVLRAPQTMQHKLCTGLAWAQLNSVFTGSHSFPLSKNGSYNPPYMQDTLTLAKPKAQGHCQSSFASWQPRNHLVVFKNSIPLQRPFPLTVVLQFKFGHSSYLQKPVASIGFISV